MSPTMPSSVRIVPKILFRFMVFVLELFLFCSLRQLHPFAFPVPFAHINTLLLQLFLVGVEVLSLSFTFVRHCIQVFLMNKKQKECRVADIRRQTLDIRWAVLCRKLFPRLGRGGSIGAYEFRLCSGFVW